MRIEVESDQIYEASVCLNEKADVYGECIQRLFSRVKEMQSIWQGVDHLAFQEQLETFRPSLKEMEVVIHQYADALRNTAHVYEALQQDRVAQAKRLL